MLTLRQILIAAWIVLLLTVFLRRIDGTPEQVQVQQPANGPQIMQVIERP